MQNADYWKRRYEILEAARFQAGDEVIRNFERISRNAQRELDSQITRWYTRFAENNKIDMTEARRLLNNQELFEFKWNVDEYIKWGQSNARIGGNALWARRLENASARYHISRLEALQIQTQNTLEQLFGNQLDSLDTLLRDQYVDAFNRSMFEVQHGFRTGFDVAAIDERRLNHVLSKPWIADAQTFSDRIWRDKVMLVDEVHNQITQGILLGTNPQTLIDNLAKKMDTTRSNAARLVQTETAFFASLAQADSYRELNVEKFQIVATLDKLTSDICQDMDGKVFLVRDLQPGVTAPPFHPWCRSTTVPHFEDDFGERVGRDEDGNRHYVPSDMKYEEWKAAYVDKTQPPRVLPLKPSQENSNIDLWHRPDEVAGVKRDTPMEWDRANHEHANPKFRQGGGYRINCQTCVVAFEARLRGYNVSALPNTPGSKLAELARATNKAWIDPATGKHPAYILDQSATTPKKYVSFMEQTVKPGERYTIQFSWKGRSRAGHIISLDRDVDGLLRLYDPQTGETFMGKALEQYMGRLKYTMTFYGSKTPVVPKLLRVDNLYFNMDMVNDILEGVTP